MEMLFFAAVVKDKGVMLGHMQLIVPLFSEIAIKYSYGIKFCFTLTHFLILSKSK